MGNAKGRIKSKEAGHNITNPEPSRISSESLKASVEMKTTVEKRIPGINSPRRVKNMNLKVLYPVKAYWRSCLMAMAS